MTTLNLVALMSGLLISGTACVMNRRIRSSSHTDILKSQNEMRRWEGWQVAMIIRIVGAVGAAMGIWLLFEKMGRPPASAFNSYLILLATLLMGLVLDAVFSIKMSGRGTNKYPPV